MAMIMEQAGGKASTGDRRILDILPKKIHERQPIFMGSPRDIEEVEGLYRQMNAKAKDKAAGGADKPKARL
jgi:fructose-1,6-bisphosphatase I